VPAWFGEFIYFSVFDCKPILQTKKYADNGNQKIAVLIPGYKEDGVIIEVATALQQEYPSNLYDVVIIADSFKRDNRCTKYFTNKSN
jgi:cellulose synthase/poly-beta-1,6-N-acetylglucosamine synthase-like glycosyltransferase